MNIKWHRIAGTEDEIAWQQNSLTIVEVAGKPVTLARYNNQIFACAYKCPHASGVFADGFLDATGNIVCPLHRYKFNLVNGRNVTGEGYRLKTFPIEQRADGIFIALEEKSLSNF